MSCAVTMHSQRTILPALSIADSAVRGVGPGQYGQSMSEALPTGPAYTIAGRPVVKEEKREDSAPGPGHYHSERGAEVRFSSPSLVVGCPYR
jgi:hypothetical protein